MGTNVIFYFQELHELHSQNPLCPEYMLLNYDDLSPTSKLLLNGGKSCSYKSEKLTASFLKRIQYTIHYMNLKVSILF